MHSEYESRLKSPKKLKSPGSKTSVKSSNTFSERYIPIRIEEQQSLYEMGAVNSEHESTYEQILKSELLSPTKPKGILQYKIPTFNTESPFDLSPMGEESKKLLSAPKKPERKISRTPFKTLQAPTIQDDFYLNLVDWSSKNVIAVGLSSAVYLWNGVTNQVVRLCDLGSRATVTAVRWVQRGTHLAVGTSSGTIEIWDVSAKKRVRTFHNHSGRVGTLDWNAHILSSGSRDRSIYHCDVRSPDSFSHFSKGHKQEVCGIEWSHDGSMLASGGNDNHLLIWDYRTSEPLLRFTDHTAAVKAITWSPHQRGLLASGGGTADRCIRFRNALTGTAINHIDTGSQVCNLAWSKNVNELVSTHGYSQNQIVVWNYPSMNSLVTLTGHTMRVLYLAVSPDGSTIVTGAGDQTLRFWNVFPQKGRALTSTLSNRLEIR